MLKRIYILSIILVLVGCSSTTSETSILTKTEEIIINSNDETKLISFYKQNLERIPGYMLKLINAYLEQEDSSSAKIYIDMLSEAEKATPEAMFAIARMHYYDRDLDAAAEQIDRLTKMSKRDPEVFLLAGKVYAGRGQFSLAKKSFQEALRLGYEDKVIKNNLALLCMMQGQYDAAIKILSPLYQVNPEDQTVESNLLVAVINNGNISMARKILTNRYGADVAEQNLALLMKSKVLNKNESETLSEKGSVELSATDIYKQNVIEDVMPTATADRMPLISPVIKSEFRGSKVFRVQIFASNEGINEIQLDRFKKYKTDIYFYNFGFWKRYCVGAFTTIKEARAFKDHLDVKGSFVVEYSNKDYKIVYDNAS